MRGYGIDGNAYDFAHTTAPEFWSILIRNSARLRSIISLVGGLLILFIPFKSTKSPDDTNIFQTLLKMLMPDYILLTVVHQSKWAERLEYFKTLEHKLTGCQNILCCSLRRKMDKYLQHKLMKQILKSLISVLSILSYRKSFI